MPKGRFWVKRRRDQRAGWHQTKKMTVRQERLEEMEKERQKKRRKSKKK